MIHMIHPTHTRTYAPSASGAWAWLAMLAVCGAASACSASHDEDARSPDAVEDVATEARSDGAVGDVQGDSPTGVEDTSHEVPDDVARDSEDCEIALEGRYIGPDTEDPTDCDTVEVVVQERDKDALVAEGFFCQEAQEGNCSCALGRLTIADFGPERTKQAICVAMEYGSPIYCDLYGP